MILPRISLATCQKTHNSYSANSISIQCLKPCLCDLQVPGAASGRTPVGQTANVLPQRTAAQHRRTGCSQSQAGGRHQLAPAGKPGQEQRRREGQLGFRALQHPGREDGRKGTRDFINPVWCIFLLCFRRIWNDGVIRMCSIRSSGSWIPSPALTHRGTWRLPTRPRLLSFPIRKASDASTRTPATKTSPSTAATAAEASCSCSEAASS